MFAVSFDEIAPVVGRSPAATRQLASRARRRIQADGTTPEADVAQQRRIVDAFFDASRHGRFEDLLTLLDPDVVMRSDAAGVRAGGTAEARGAATVAGFFNGRAQGVVLATIDGAAGGVVLTDAGTPWIAISLTVADGRIIGIDSVLDPDQIARLEVTILD